MTATHRWLEEFDCTPFSGTSSQSSKNNRRALRANDPYRRFANRVPFQWLRRMRSRVPGFGPRP